MESGLRQRLRSGHSAFPGPDRRLPRTPDGQRTPTGGSIDENPRIRNSYPRMKHGLNTEKSNLESFSFRVRSVFHPWLWHFQVFLRRDSHARIVPLPDLSGIRPHQFGSGAGGNLASRRGSQAFGVTERGARMLPQTPRRLRHDRPRRRAYLHRQSKVLAVAAVKLFSLSRTRPEGRTDSGADDGPGL